jgi:hypothetical protein
MTPAQDFRVHRFVHDDLPQIRQTLSDVHDDVYAGSTDEFDQRLPWFVDHWGGHPGFAHRLALGRGELFGGESRVRGGVVGAGGGEGFGMGDGGWWVPVVTAVTAVGASWVTSRGNASGVRVQAEVESHARRVTDQMDRRRAAYRELSAQAHALAEVFWRMEEVDRLPGSADRARVVTEMHAASRESLNRVTKSSRDVLLEGPANVAGNARELQRSAVATHLLLIELGDGRDPARTAYDRAYESFNRRHVRFVEAAREALEVK